MNSISTFSNIFSYNSLYLKRVIKKINDPVIENLILNPTPLPTNTPEEYLYHVSYHLLAVTHEIKIVCMSMLSAHNAILPATGGMTLRLKHFKSNLNRMSNSLDVLESILHILKWHKGGLPKVRAQILSRISAIINCIFKFFSTPEWSKISVDNSDTSALLSLCDKAKQYSSEVKSDTRQVLISMSRFTGSSTQDIEASRPRGVSSGLTLAEEKQLNQFISSVMSNVMEYSIQLSGRQNPQSRLTVKAKVKLSDISGVDPNIWKYNLRMKSSLVTNQIGGIVDISSEIECFFKLGSMSLPNSALASSIIQFLSDIY